ncbi:MAG: hypothetical protein LBG66_06050 [Gallionellaceae bacterium]|jgi:hypothetical protein|nr:hypothetical protein [Gallionellaceae bacterium]
MKGHIVRNWIFLLSLLSFSVVALVDDFITETAVMTLFFWTGFVYYLYKIFRFLCFCFAFFASLLKRDRKKVKWNKIMPLNLLAPAVVLVVFFNSMNSLQDAVEENSEPLANGIQTCFRENECPSIINTLKIRRDRENVFSVTYGMLTMAIWAGVQENGCIRIYSLYHYHSINVIKC